MGVAKICVRAYSAPPFPIILAMPLLSTTICLGLCKVLQPRAYRLLKEKRAYVTSNLAKFKSRLKIVKFLNMYSAVQTADVTIISYKPMSDLNFARYTQQYGSYMPSSPSEFISPCYNLVPVVAYHSAICTVVGTAVLLS